MKNPVKEALLEIAPTVMGACRKLEVGFENTRRIIAGIPRDVPASFKMALVQRAGWTDEKLNALDEAYRIWRAGH